MDVEAGIISPLGLVSISVAVTVIFIAYRFLVSPYRTLSRYGIRGPSPLPLVGNLLSFQKMGSIPFLDENFKKYGFVFGFYIGPQAKIAIADVDLLKDIMVKEFDSFTDRGYVGPPQFVPKALGLHTGLIMAKGELWRTFRHILTPSFTRMKIKLMVPLIKKSSDVLVEKMGEFAESGKAVELFREYGYFTTESLIATAFGRYVNLQRGEADQITDDAKKVLKTTQEEAAISPATLLACLSNFPWLEPLLLLAIRKSKVGQALIRLNMTASSLIRDRVQSQQPPKVKDLLQLMIDSAIEDGKDPQNDQIAGFSVEFLLAGYDTTTAALSFMSYLLAMNTDVQEKLQTEIDEFFEEHPEASLYEAAQKLKYLDMVIQESLRFHTPVSKINRYCSKTVTVGNVTIPEGAEIIIPIDLIHHSPKYWPDPYKFDPERFTDEAKASRPQLAHMPFGWGPRSCIGLRFALLESKIALMEILRKFSFVRAPETAANLELLYGTTTTSKDGVWLKIVARN